MPAAIAPQQASLRMQLEYRLTRLTTRAGFRYNGRSVPYFDVPLFVGDQPWPFWRTERTLELALIRDFVARFDGPGLEVGHVMALYMDRPHTVVDKYEQGPGVLNLDIVDYHPAQTFDWIVACSTVEHVGWDEDVIDPDKPLQAIRHLRTLLSPTGTLLTTVPLGYNPNLDDQIRFRRLEATEQTFFYRNRYVNRWAQSTVYRSAPYDGVLGHANGLWVATYPHLTAQ